MDEPKQILQQLRNLNAIVDVLSWIASRFDKAIDRLEAQQSIDDVLRELSEYLTSNIDRIDRMLLLILDRQPDRPNLPERIRRETAELKQETIDNRITSLRAQLARHHDNLNYLEEQAANYGPNVTVEIKNQIEWTKAAINQIEQAIKDLQKQ